MKERCEDTKKEFYELELQHEKLKQRGQDTPQIFSFAGSPPRSPGARSIPETNILHEDIVSLRSEVRALRESQNRSIVGREDVQRALDRVEERGLLRLEREKTKRLKKQLMTMREEIARVYKLRQAHLEKMIEMEEHHS